MSNQGFNSILESHPDMETYFRSLPPSTQQSILLANPHITSLKELMHVVANMYDFLN